MKVLTYCVEYEETPVAELPEVTRCFGCGRF